MPDIDLKRLQDIELDILDEFLRVCRENDLTTFMVGGSLLGTIRHHGFIPWDDDIDVAMSRKDYETFRKIANSQLKDGYFFQDCTTEKKSGLVFGKIRKDHTTMSEKYSYHIDMHQGIWIDIFVYDYVSDDAKTRKKDLDHILFLKNLYIIKSGYKLPENRSFLFNCAYYGAKVASAFVSIDSLIHKLENEMKKYGKTNHVFPYGGANLKVDLMPATLIEELIDAQFEGRNVKVFKDYDHYLSALYGNYMQLPKEEDRKNGSSHFLHELKFE